MKNDIAIGDDAVQIRGHEVDRHEFEGLRLARLLDIAQLLFASVVVVEAVDAGDSVAIHEQRVAQMRADESRAASD
jgi:hypothetical protein